MELGSVAGTFGPVEVTWSVDGTSGPVEGAFGPVDGTFKHVDGKVYQKLKECGLS